jgi:hypothetical protein
MRRLLDSIPVGVPPDSEAIPHKRATGGAPIKERVICL